MSDTRASALLALGDELSAKLATLEFESPVTHVYNPLEYAREMFAAYLTLAVRAKHPILFLGMNPGPWGMAQTGVPFGEVAAVRDWMKLSGEISSPADFHPKRPVEGLDCKRSEVSGARLWGWAQDRYRTPKKFFDKFFVMNYCPLLFLAAKERSVANITPDKLKKEERLALADACDAHLVAALEIIQPRLCIGVGAYAKKCFERVSKENDLVLRVESILHPSPASPIANRGWAQQAEKQLRDMGVDLPS